MWTEDILNYFESNSLGTCGTDLFWGVLPDMPKYCGAVLPAPGGSAEEAFGSTASGCRNHGRSSSGGPGHRTRYRVRS